MEDFDQSQDHGIEKPPPLFVDFAVFPGGYSQSGGKYFGEGNRQPGEKGRFEKIALAVFERVRITPGGKSEELDGFRLRIDDPVFGNAEPLVEGMFHPAVGRFRRRGQDLDGQVRNSLDVLFSNDGQMLFRDKEQVRFDHLNRIFGKNHVAGSG